MIEAFIASILAVTIRAGTSLLYATLGEILNERAGVLNMGVEGVMILSATLGFAAAYYSGSVAVGFLAAMLTGALLGLLHATLTVGLRTEQVVTGLAITILGTGLASFLGQRLGPGGRSMVGLSGPKLSIVPIPFLSELPVVGSSVFSQDVATYFLYLLVPVLGVVLYRTRLGLHVRAVGEKPQTADAMGVNVAANRFWCTIIGATLMGLGGATLSLAYTPGWAEGMTAGRGWIAIALVIFSNWDPARAALGALLFGGITAVQFRLQAKGIHVQPAFLAMLPYVTTVVVLVITTWYDTFHKRVGGPSALGVPYLREERR
jgi:general nucleoside transport system permease protein